MLQRRYTLRKKKKKKKLTRNFEKFGSPYSSSIASRRFLYFAFSGRPIGAQTTLLGPSVACLWSALTSSLAARSWAKKQRKKKLTIYTQSKLENSPCRAVISETASWLWSWMTSETGHGVGTAGWATARADVVEGVVAMGAGAMCPPETAFRADDARVSATALGTWGLARAFFLLAPGVVWRTMRTVQDKLNESKVQWWWLMTHQGSTFYIPCYIPCYPTQSPILWTISSTGDEVAAAGCQLVARGWSVDHGVEDRGQKEELNIRFLPWKTRHKKKETAPKVMWRGAARRVSLSRLFTSQHHSNPSPV